MNPGIYPFPSGRATAGGGSAAGGATPFWTSGDTVAQWEIRKSRLDGEDYMRKTATGAGTVDPADDVTNYTSWSFFRTLALTNAWSSGGAPRTLSSLTPTNGNLSVTSLTPAAGVRTSLLSITGKGTLYSSGFLHSNPAAHTARVELFIDGRSVFDATNSVVVTTSQVVLFNGAYYEGGASGSYTVIPQPVEFARSMQVWATLSVLPAANRFYFGYDAKLRG